MSFIQISNIHKSITLMSWTNGRKRVEAFSTRRKNKFTVWTVSTLFLPSLFSSSCYSFIDIWIKLIWILCESAAIRFLIYLIYAAATGRASSLEIAQLFSSPVSSGTSFVRVAQEWALQKCHHRKISEEENAMHYNQVKAEHWIYFLVATKNKMTFQTQIIL